METTQSPRVSRCARLPGRLGYWAVVSWWWPFLLGSKQDRVMAWGGVLTAGISVGVGVGAQSGKAGPGIAAGVAAALLGLLGAIAVGAACRPRQYGQRGRAGYWLLQDERGWACACVYPNDRDHVWIVESLVSVGSWRKILNPMRRDQRGYGGKLMDAIACHANQAEQTLTLRARDADLEAFYQRHDFTVDDTAASWPRKMTRTPQATQR